MRFSSISKKLLEIKWRMDTLSWVQLTFTIMFFLIFMVIPLILVSKSAFTDDIGRLSFSWFGLIFNDHFFFTNPLSSILTSSFVQLEPISNTLYLTGIDCGVLFNTLFVALITTIFSTVLGVTVAFFMARYKFWGKSVFQTAMIIPLLSSPFIGAIGIKRMIGINGVLNLLFYDTLHILPFRIVIDGLAAVIFVQVLSFFALIYINAYTAFVNIDPTLEEQAENIGSRGFHLFKTITFPLAMPGIVAGAILTFILSIEDLGTPVVFHDNTQATKLLSYQIFSRIFAPTGDINPIAPALGFILLVVAIMGFFVMRKYVSLRRYAMISKGGTWNPRMTTVSKKRTIVILAVLILTLGFALIPHTGIILLSLAKTWGVTILPTEMTLSNYSLLFEDTGVAGSVYNSLFYCISATIIITILGTSAAYVISRKNIPGKNALDTLVTMPVAIPGIVLAIAYFTTFLHTPLSPLISPVPLLITSYTVRKIPFTIRSVFAGLQQTPETLEEASLSLGASSTRTFFRITMPLILVNILAGGMLSFVYSMSEVSTSLILGGVQAEAAPLTWKMKDVLWQVSAGPFMAAVLGVLLMVIQIVVITTVNRILRQRLSVITGI
ncbi:MAG: iron(III) transport system permease protein [Thermoproteota archaeon]|nr:iron(III) transport system permease protein [Thermoproteota archaeon]